MSFVGIFFCMTIIAIVLISSSSNSPIMNNNYYHAHAATLAEKQLQGTNNNNISLPNLIRQGSPYLGEPTTAPITIIDFSDKEMKEYVDFQLYPKSALYVNSN